MNTYTLLVHFQDWVGVIRDNFHDLRECMVYGNLMWSTSNIMPPGSFFECQADTWA